MNNQRTVDLKNSIELRKKGIAALTAALGPVGMARFIRQYDTGYGDYTKERHEYLDDVTVDDFKKMLAEYDKNQQA
jgi:hypothetical protein